METSLGKNGVSKLFPSEKWFGAMDLGNWAFKFGGGLDLEFNSA